MELSTAQLWRTNLGFIVTLWSEPEETTWTSWNLVQQFALSRHDAKLTTQGDTDFVQDSPVCGISHSFTWMYRNIFKGLNGPISYGWRVCVALGNKLYNTTLLSWHSWTASKDICELQPSTKTGRETFWLMFYRVYEFKIPFLYGLLLSRGNSLIPTLINLCPG